MQHLARKDQRSGADWQKNKKRQERKQENIDKLQQLPASIQLDVIRGKNKPFCQQPDLFFFNIHVNFMFQMFILVLKNEKSRPFKT